MKQLLVISFLFSLSFQSLCFAEPAQVVKLDPLARFHPVIAEKGVTVSQEAIASQVGTDILAAGGNAVDAAVATGFALAVTLPRAGNIGGGGFMLVHLAEENKTIAIDYREMAPLRLRGICFSMLRAMSIALKPVILCTLQACRELLPA